jgi:hypothetical protein
MIHTRTHTERKRETETDRETRQHAALARYTTTRFCCRCTPNRARCVGTLCLHITTMLPPGYRSLLAHPRYPCPHVHPHVPMCPHVIPLPHRDLPVTIRENFAPQPATRRLLLAISRRATLLGASRPCHHAAQRRTRPNTQHPSMLSLLLSHVAQKPTPSLTLCPRPVAFTLTYVTLLASCPPVSVSVTPTPWPWASQAHSAFDESPCYSACSETSHPRCPLRWHPTLPPRTPPTRSIPAPCACR